MTSFPDHTLNEIYQSVMSWLHFAEAKNAVLVTLSSGVIFGITTVYSQLTPAPSFFVCGIMIWVCSCSFVSLSLSAVSFLPQVRLLPWYGRATGTGTNVYFFGHISEMGTDNFIRELGRKLGVDTFSEADLDLAQQIVVNSKIARKKYAIFSTALWFFLLGITSPVGALVIYWFLIEEVH